MLIALHHGADNASANYSIGAVLRSRVIFSAVQHPAGSHGRAVHRSRRYLPRTDMGDNEGGIKTQTVDPRVTRMPTVFFPGSDLSVFPARLPLPLNRTPWNHF